MGNRIAVALAVALCIAPARRAVADPDAAAKAQAKSHYDQARALHAQGAHQRAAAEYLQAYSFLPDPELLFNVAQVYRLAGDQALAIAYYRRYLDLDPDGRAAPEARRNLELMGASAKAGAAASAWGDAPDTPAREVARPARGDASMSLRAESRPASSRGRWMRLGGGALALSGAVLLGFGIASGIEARGIAAELSSVDRWTDDRLARFEEGEAAERRMVIFTVSGLVAVAGGGVLYWFGSLEDRPSTEVTAAVTPDGDVGIVARGNFW